MRISSETLANQAEATGFRPDILEKVALLLQLLDAVRSHPFLKDKLVLKGGTALNLFIFDVPRLSIDIDLNYVGAADRETMLTERPKIEEALPGKVAQKAAWVLRLLEDLEMVPANYFKKLIGTDDIWECRIQYGSNIYRIFCFFDSHSVIILTHGFEKKSMKTPRQEIERAETYRHDYLNRKGKKR